MDFLEDLLEEAKKEILLLPPGLDRLEKDRLLEGIEGHPAEHLNQDEAMLTFELLYNFNLPPSKIEINRNAYLADQLLKTIKKKGFTKDSFKFEAIRETGLPDALLYPAAHRLCKMGSLDQVTEDEYEATLKLWSQEIASLAEKEKKVLSSLDDIGKSRDRNDEAMRRRFLESLDDTNEIAKTLGIFGFREIAKKIESRTKGEIVHMNQHHAGPWGRTRARDHAVFLREALETLPKDFR